MVLMYWRGFGGGVGVAAQFVRARQGDGVLVWLKLAWRRRGFSVVRNWRCCALANGFPWTAMGECHPHDSLGTGNVAPSGPRPNKSASDPKWVGGLLSKFCKLAIDSDIGLNGIRSGLVCKNTSKDI